MKVYIASPFFNDRQLNDTIAVEEACKKAGWDFYSPRLGTISKEYGTLNENSDPYQVYLYKTMVFAEDIKEIDSADIVMVNYDNKDSGTLFELGYALANNKTILCSSRDPNVRKEFKNFLSLAKKLIVGSYSYFETKVALDFRKNDLIKINHDVDNVIAVIAEHSNDPYLGLSKVVLGYLYGQNGNERLIYIDVPRKSNLMLTSSVEVFECANLKIFDELEYDRNQFWIDLERILTFECKPVDETTKDE